MEDGWTPRQSWKKNATGNRAFRMPKMQDYVPRSAEQKENLSTNTTIFINAKPNSHDYPFTSSFSFLKTASLKHRLINDKNNS